VAKPNQQQGQIGKPRGERGGRTQNSPQKGPARKNDVTDQYGRGRRAQKEKIVSKKENRGGTSSGLEPKKQWRPSLKEREGGFTAVHLKTPKRKSQRGERWEPGSVISHEAGVNRSRNGQRPAKRAEKCSHILGGGQTKISCGRCKALCLPIREAGGKRMGIRERSALRRVLKTRKCQKKGRKGNWQENKQKTKPLNYKPSKKGKKNTGPKRGVERWRSRL